MTTDTDLELQSEHDRRMKQERLAFANLWMELQPRLPNTLDAREQGAIWDVAWKVWLAARGFKP